MNKDKKWMYAVKPSSRFGRWFTQIIFILFLCVFLFVIFEGVRRKSLLIIILTIDILTLFFCLFPLSGISFLEIFCFRKIFITKEEIITKILFFKIKRKINDITKIEKEVLFIPRKSHRGPFPKEKMKNPNEFHYSIYFKTDSGGKRDYVNLDKIRLWDIVTDKEKECSKIEEFISSFWQGNIKTIYGTEKLEDKNVVVYWSLDRYQNNVLHKLIKWDKKRSFWIYFCLLLFFIIALVSVLLYIWQVI